LVAHERLSIGGWAIRAATGAAASDRPGLSARQPDLTGHRSLGGATQAAAESTYTAAMPDPETLDVLGPEFLKSVPLFEHLSRRDLRNLALAGHDLTYPAGMELTSLQDFPAVFFIIVEGRASVTADGETRRPLGPREWFGELALIGGGPRTAVVTAETEIRCLVLTRWEFRAFLKEHPDVSWTLLETIAKRLSPI
jgi:hypothetical protein